LEVGKLIEVLNVDQVKPRGVDLGVKDLQILANAVE